MKSFVNILFVLSIIFIFTFSGCELFTNTPDQNGGDTFGDNLIISEIFTIPPHQYYAYSWIEVYNPSRKSFYWFEQSFPSIALVVGEEGAAAYTEDNGYTWQSITIPTTNTLRATSFSLTDTGLAVGDKGTIIRFTRLEDGTMIASDYSYTNPDPAMKNLNDIYLITAPGRAGYMVGDSGGIFRTTNRGNNWDLYTNQRLPYNLHSINYQNFDRIWTVGDSGVIMRSHSAKIWTPKAPPEEFPTANFYACTFMWDTGWAVGENGAIAFTKSGGNIFVAQDCPVTTTLRDVFFSRASVSYNPQMGWIVGDDGVILKTTNWGDEWMLKESNTTADLFNVYFADSTRGFAIGENGTMLVTFDGGESWYNNPFSPTVSTLYGSHFNPPNVFVQDRYVMEIRAKRKEFFIDLATGTINYNVFVKIDSGYVVFDPAVLIQFGIETEAIPPGGFTVINSDSTRFTNHTKLGPGQVSVINANIGYYFDTTATATYGVRPVLWDLLSTGEIRLIKYSEKFDRFNFRFLSFEKKIIDVVRWGEFTVPDSVTYASQYNQVWPQGSYYVLVPYKGNEPRYDNNISAGFLPEWHSLARYANDNGNADPYKLNTSTSFFIANDPIPGWYSQRRK